VADRNAPPPSARSPRLTLRGKVLLGYGVLLLAFAAVLLAVLAEMRQTEASLATLSSGYLPLAREVAGAESWPLGIELEADVPTERLYRVRRSETLVVERMRSQLDRAEKTARALAGVERSPGDASVLVAIADQVQVVAGLLSRYAEAHAAFVRDFELRAAIPGPPDPVGAGPRAPPADPAASIPGLLDLRSQIDVNLRVLAKRAARRIADVVERTERAQRDARFLVVALSGAAFGIGLFLLIATHFTLRPIRRLISVAERIREGHFDERMPVDAADEVGRLARSFNAMAASIQERERRIEERSQQLEQALQELRASQDALVRTERLAAIGEVAAQIAHEVRNPLNALGLNAELLLDAVKEGDAPEAERGVAAIKAEVQRLKQVTEGYLSVGRLPKLHVEPTDVGALLRDLLRFQKEELERAGVALELALPDEGLPDVSVDASQLRQALLNILRNAGEALAPAGGGHLRVGARRDGDSLRIDVADDGPGIPAELATRIFDPFFSTKDKGSGLGLPITHQIVAEHGGRIACTTLPGRGTTFSLWLPIRRAASA
jgi:signal transduction histidine kinase